MEAPKCRLCHTRHWGSGCPTFQKMPGASLAEIVKAKGWVAPVAGATSGSAMPTKVEKPLSVKVAGSSFDRVAYQREYMRKWRAKKNDPR